MKVQVLSTLLIMFFASGCAGIDGLLHQRTFIDEMEHETDGYFVPGENFQIIPGDSGSAYRSKRDIQHRTPASIYDKEADEYQRSIQKELAEKEKTLSPKEYRDYVENTEYYPSASEKIYFLSLSRAERREYLETKGVKSFDSRTRTHHNALAATTSFENRFNNYVQEMASSGRSLYLGMNKDGVIENWGRPARVDVAGDPRHENERWSFVENGRVKVVYFESGRVQGWAMD